KKRDASLVVLAEDEPRADEAQGQDRRSDGREEAADDLEACAHRQQSRGGTADGGQQDTELNGGIHAILHIGHRRGSPAVRLVEMLGYCSEISRYAPLVTDLTEARRATVQQKKTSPPHRMPSFFDIISAIAGNRTTETSGNSFASESQLGLSGHAQSV